MMLAACGGAPPDPAETQAAPAQSATPAGKGSARQVDAKPVAAPTTPVETATLRTEPKEPEIPVNDDPAQFMGSGVTALQEVLGTPALIRRDGKAEVWQFRGDACTLDLFLYPEGAAGLAVTHVELRGEGDDDERACLARMLRARIVAADG